MGGWETSSREGVGCTTCCSQKCRYVCEREIKRETVVPFLGSSLQKETSHVWLKKIRTYLFKKKVVSTLNLNFCPCPEKTGEWDSTPGLQNADAARAAYPQCPETLVYVYINGDNRGDVFLGLVKNHHIWTLFINWGCLIWGQH